MPVPGAEPPKALVTSVCGGADGSCTLVHLELRGVIEDEDGFDRIAPERGKTLWYDTNTGDVGPAEDPEARWLKAHLTSAVEQRLQDRWERQRGQLDQHAWRRFQWSTVEFGDLVSRRKVLPASWDPIVQHGDELYLADDHYCINPRCDCTTVTIYLSELLEDGKLRDLSTIRVAVEDGSVHAGKIDNPLARTLWAKFEAQQEFVNEIPEYRDRMRTIGDTLNREGIMAFGETRPRQPIICLPDPEPYRRTQAKVGRNAPCPCGSGRKYKRCCLGKENDSA